MLYETILYEKKDQVAVITLNRPQQLNAMSSQTVHELSQAVDELNSDPDVRVFIITGTPRADGRPCFTAGADLKEVAAGGPHALGQENLLDRISGVYDCTQPNQEIRRCFENILGLPKPSIAAIDGICTAGGIELANVCDLRVVAETAQISDVHMKNLGGIGAAGAGVALARIVGVQKAKQLLFTSDIIDGREAVRIGYAIECFPSDRLMEGALELARKIAAMRPEGIRMAKFTVNAAFDMPLLRAIRLSYLACWAPAYTINESVPDAKAFVEKKKPPKR